MVMLSGLALESSAQSLIKMPQRHALGIDLTAFARKGLGFSYMFMVNSHAALEFRYGQEKYPVESSTIFNGDWSSDYLEQRTDSEYEGQVTKGQWQTLGGGKPLPDAPGHVPGNLNYIQTGFRFNHLTQTKRWRLFLQPGVSVWDLHYYSIQTELTQQVETDQQWKTGPYYDLTFHDLYTREIRQVRHMRLEHKISFALTYDMGVTFFISRCIFLEGRISAGLNPESPYKDGTLPELTHPYYLRTLLLAGLRF